VLAEPGNAPLWSAAFSPNGKEIVTAGADGTTRIWSTALAGPLRAIERIAALEVARELNPAERAAFLAGH
jgi:WD40 repeat protein